MPDEQNPLQRARPAAPAMPPFRGHAPAVRPASASKAPGSGRVARPVIAVRPAKAQQAELPEPAAAEILPLVSVEAPPAQPPERSEPALILEPPGAEVMPSHATSVLPPGPLPTLAPEAWGTYAPPAEAPVPAGDAEGTAAAAPLIGLPDFDDAGQPHGAVQSPVVPAVEASTSQRHAAAVLERIAANIRAGTLAVDGVDPAATDPAALAAVLASLLREPR